MDFAQILWTIALCISIVLTSSVLVWSLHRDYLRTHIPPGLKQRRKLYRMLPRTGIGNQYHPICRRSVWLPCCPQPQGHPVCEGSLHALDLSVFTVNTRPQPTALSQCSLTNGHYLEKFGICSQIAVLRGMFNGVPSMNDPKLNIKNLYFEHVPVRVYWPKLSPPVGNLRGILYLHGGIGILGSIKTYDRMCRYLAKESESVVVCIGYRLSPEHPPPVQFQDSLKATLYFLKNARFYAVDPNRIVIVGDSSGATMAAALCQELAVRTDVPRIQAQILLYPFLQAVDFTLPSYQQNHSVPILFKKRAVKLAFQYFTQPFKVDLTAALYSAHVSDDMKAKCKKWISADHIPDEFKVRGYVPTEPAPYSEQLGQLCKPALEPWFSPLLAEDEVIRQLPETFLLTCEYDILRDDGLLYKKRLEDNGVPVTWHHAKDGFHGIVYLVSLGPFQFPSTKIAMNNVIRFIRRLPK